MTEKESVLKIAKRGYESLKFPSRMIIRRARDIKKKMLGASAGTWLARWSTRFTISFGLMTTYKLKR